MAVIKKIGVLSLAKLQALIMAVFGLFLGGVYSAIYAFMPNAAAIAQQSQAIAMMGYSSIIILPLVYATIGFVFGAIGALLYNLFSKWIGGLEIDIGK